MDKALSRRAILLWAAALAAALFLALSLLSIPFVSVFAQVMLAGLGLLVFLWLLVGFYRAFLWKVGRRLAFSYFLIGVLPIPMVLLLLTVVSYLLAGFFLGHLYRDAVEEVQVELEQAVRVRAEAFARTGAVPEEPAPENIIFGYYRNGRRVGGDPSMPATMPAAWPAGIRSEGRRGEIADGEPALRFYPARNGDPTLAASAGEAGRGVVALYAGDLSGEVSRRAGLWVEIEKPGELDLEVVNLAIGEHRIPLQRLGGMGRGADAEAEKFMKRLSKGERFWDDSLLSWVEVSGPLIDPGSGRMLSEYVPAVLSGTPRIVASHLFTGSSVDTATWGALLVLSLLLLNVYGVAVLMAVFMIFGLSYAVNRLSRATEAVRQGDFSVRIPVRRKDQVGDLQRSFNQMAGDLESLVATATQKELLEKELSLARDLQKSLLPSDLPSGHGAAIAALFEPSAAIGGDYFDVLRISEGVLAVFIADVS
ncbi:MAG TPA: HAMP domain-containing protein, partial [Thermoanaerobaculia bacterium]|nr:HAMP domain-containing protein [Thermoanaerobaculia bacterium]